MELTHSGWQLVISSTSQISQHTHIQAPATAGSACSGKPRRRALCRYRHQLTDTAAACTRPEMPRWRAARRCRGIRPNRSTERQCRPGTAPWHCQPGYCISLASGPVTPVGGARETLEGWLERATPPACVRKCVIHVADIMVNTGVFRIKHHRFHDLSFIFLFLLHLFIEKSARHKRIERHISLRLSSAAA